MYWLIVIFLLLIIVFLLYNNKQSNKKVHLNEDFDNFIDNVYCINLNTNNDRFLLLDNMAKKENIQLNRFEAIDTRGVLYLKYKTLIHPNSYNKLYDTILRKSRKTHDELTPGAIGCYLSHLNLYKEALDRGDKLILVFEDDTVIPNNFKYDLLKKTKNLPKDFDIFLLGWISKGKNNIKVSEDIVKVRKYILMHSYLITDVGMRKIISTGLPIRKQIDHMISDNSNYINIYGTYPNGWVKQGVPSKNAAYLTNIQIPVKRSEIENFSMYNTNNNLLVIVYENTLHPNSLKLKSLLIKREFPFKFIGLGDEWKGFGTKTHAIINYLNENKESIDDNMYIICLDSRDVIVNQNVDYTIKCLKQFDDNKLIISSERGCCVPTTTLNMRKYVESKNINNYDHQYLNAGMIAGKAKVFRKIYPFNIKESDDDQTGLIKWWQNHPNDIILDYKQILFSNAFGWENEEFETACPYVLKNNNCNKKPCFIQTPAKFWKCYDKLYKESKHLKTWYIKK
tara:strand:- start:389 stop:1918 length:1530 start_codon:yes stop_codon:yes gene_type:complete